MDTQQQPNQQQHFNQQRLKELFHWRDINNEFLQQSWDAETIKKVIIRLDAINAEIKAMGQS